MIRKFVLAGAAIAVALAEEGADVVVAVGGDGTVNEVVTGLLASSPVRQTAVAVVPYGTANDFATACGIAKGDPLAALRLAAEGTVASAWPSRLSNSRVSIRSVFHTSVRSLTLTSAKD